MRDPDPARATLVVGERKYNVRGNLFVIVGEPNIEIQPADDN